MAPYGKRCRYNSYTLDISHKLTYKKFFYLIQSAISNHSAHTIVAQLINETGRSLSHISCNHISHSSQGTINMISSLICYMCVSTAILIMVSTPLGGPSGTSLLIKPNRPFYLMRKWGGQQSYFNWQEPSGTCPMTTGHVSLLYSSQIFALTTKSSSSDTS